MFTFHVMDLTALSQGEVGGAVHGGVGGHSVVVRAVTLRQGQHQYTRTWEEGGLLTCVVEHSPVLRSKVKVLQEVEAEQTIPHSLTSPTDRSLHTEMENKKSEKK